MEKQKYLLLLETNLHSYLTPICENTNLKEIKLQDNAPFHISTITKQ